jgi:hypothetical protein
MQMPVKNSLVLVFKNLFTASVAVLGSVAICGLFFFLLAQTLKMKGMTDDVYPALFPLIPFLATPMPMAMMMYIAGAMGIAFYGILAYAFSVCLLQVFKRESFLLFVGLAIVVAAGNGLIYGGSKKLWMVFWFVVHGGLTGVLHWLFIKKVFVTGVHPVYEIQEKNNNA